MAQGCCADIPVQACVLPSLCSDSSIRPNTVWKNDSALPNPSLELPFPTLETPATFGETTHPVTVTASLSQSRSAPQTCGTLLAPCHGPQPPCTSSLGARPLLQPIFHPARKATHPHAWCLLLCDSCFVPSMPFPSSLTWLLFRAASVFPSLSSALLHTQEHKLLLAPTAHLSWPCHSL